MEKMGNLRLIWLLETENHICEAQSGFSKNRSTTDSLVQFEWMSEMLEIITNAPLLYSLTYQRDMILHGDTGF